jgi:hydroxymethylpyrimidine kinase/phosphomethylpyrimidine kinase
VLCGIDVADVHTLEDVEKLAYVILEMGPTYVLIKGGHLDAGHPDRSIDLLVSRDDLVVLEGPRVITSNDHGTGCSLSSAIAAGLALDRSVTDATRDAKSFVLASLDGAAPWRLGAGRGPIDHLGWSE